MVASPANRSSRQPSRLGKGTKPCQREIHGVRSFLLELPYQINAELMAAVAVLTLEAPQFYRHELLPVKPDNPARFDRRKPWRNLKPRHRTSGVTEISADHRGISRLGMRSGKRPSTPLTIICQSTRIENFDEWFDLDVA